MPTKAKKSKKGKKIKYKDAWLLSYTDVEIHFVNDVAIEVAVCGKIFKATQLGRASKEMRKEQ